MERQTDRQMPDKVIPICRYVLQMTQHIMLPAVAFTVRVTTTTASLPQKYDFQIDTQIHKQTSDEAIPRNCSAKRLLYQYDLLLHVYAILFLIPKNLKKLHLSKSFLRKLGNRHMHSRTVNISWSTWEGSTDVTLSTLGHQTTNFTSLKGLEGVKRI